MITSNKIVNEVNNILNEEEVVEIGRHGGSIYLVGVKDPKKYVKDLKSYIKSVTGATVSTFMNDALVISKKNYHISANTAVYSDIERFVKEKTNWTLKKFV